MLLVLLLAHFLSAEQTEAWGHGHNPHSHIPHSHNGVGHRPNGRKQFECHLLSCPSDYKEATDYGNELGGSNVCSRWRKLCWDKTAYSGEACHVGGPARERVGVKCDNYNDCRTGNYAVC